MSGVSFPVTRPAGRALIVGQPAFRTAPAAALLKWGYVCTEVDEPYDAMVHLCRRPLFYSAIILSLNSLYREELHIIASIKRRFSHVDVWLCDTDGRQAALAEAMRLGADGLISEDGLHRVASASTATEASGAISQAPAPEKTPPPAESAKPPAEQPESSTGDQRPADPLLTVEELRALLQETRNPKAG
jgi:DNA-binding NarL/FixJ family response regulator